MPFLLICGKEFKFLHEGSGGVFEACKGPETGDQNKEWPGWGTTGDRRQVSTLPQ